MAELNFKQITDKLNEAFIGDARKLVFWYDSNAEFADDIDSMELNNAKIYHLQKDNQFQTKLFFEKEDTTTNYLVYAPFAKPDIRENHLADIILYSKEFFADRVSLLMLDLGIDERCKPTIQHYIKFFANKQRAQAFYDLEISTYTRSTIEVGLMSVLCKSKLPTFEEVARCVLTEGELEENALLAEFEKYDLLKPFWQQCELVFGYVDETPTLTKFAMTLFATYADKTIHAELPQSWRPFVSFKSGTIVAFLDSLMNSVIYQDCFDSLSETVYQALDGENQLKGILVDDLVECNLFRGVDRLILQWMTDRLLQEDVDAKIAGKTILQLCASRKRMHYGAANQDAYSVIESALNIIKAGHYNHTSDINTLTKKYTAEYCFIDQSYRNFYYHYDLLDNNAPFVALRSLVERVYTNDYLNPLSANFASVLASASGKTGLAKQCDFYNAKVKYAKDRVAVIISDALRYEVGVSLYEKLQSDEKCTASISAMQSVLPSVTRFGMAALLPHKTLSTADAENILVDDMQTATLKQREAVLQRANPNSRAVRFDEIKNMSVEELRGIFAHQDVVYIYHNQIDARGDKQATENEVFVACAETIDEISKIIRRLTISANTSHFIVTADHGFIYKRDKLTEHDKISGIAGASDRFVISETPVAGSGLCSIPMSDVCENDDSRFVNFPVGSDLFRAPGAGKNYVHGGCSPQEIIIPLIEVKTEKAKRETRVATIDLVSLLNKITNLITTLDFIQPEPISDVVKETDYRIGFVSETGEKISNEVIFKADKKDTDASKRVFRLRFSLKNRKYDTNQKYYLVAVDTNNREVLRREVIIDLAFADDFGFDL